MFISVIVVLALCCVLFSNALVELPERARGGFAYKLSQKHSMRLGDNTPLFWSAKVDNFDVTNNATFQQRYYVDNQYWDGKGPVFFEIGGEGTLSGAPGGYIGYLAKNYSALVVALEHRFYGVSVPNNRADSANYKYLTVQQALADLSSFTDYFKQSYGTKDSTWFVFGGSYPGALSSWYRSAYPHQSAGSLSSSGVVNCIVDYYQFDMQVSAAIGNQCADQIKRINAAFERAIATPSGWKKSLSQFQCEHDMWKNDFLYMIADSWSMADQYSAKSQLCEAILAVGEKATDDVLTQTFADFSNSFWGTQFCSGGFYNTEQLADPARWDVNSRSWRWQTCYEVSYFNTAPQSGSLRASSVDLDYHLKQCAKAFGHEMFPSSVAMNERFGGAFPAAHNVFYSDFSDDPWLRASVEFSPSSDQPFFYTQCNDCGHCMDFHAPSESEPIQLKQSRAEFERYLAKWLTEAK